MAFDRTDSADLTALQSELQTNPNGQTYNLDITNQVLDELNNPANNVGSPTIQQEIEDLDIPDIAAEIDSTEFAALDAYDQEWVRMFINRPIDEPLQPYRAKFLAVFGAGSNTRTDVTALLTRPASRAEILFGVNTVISRADFIAARDF